MSSFDPMGPPDEPARNDSEQSEQPLVQNSGQSEQPLSEQPLHLLTAPQVIWEGKLWPIVRECSRDEEWYVQQELAVTASQMKDGRLKDVRDSKGRGRMERTEMYARWRYRGFLAGQVASL